MFLKCSRYVLLIRSSLIMILFKQPFWSKIFESLQEWLGNLTDKKEQTVGSRDWNLREMVVKKQSSAEKERISKTMLSNNGSASPTIAIYFVAEVQEAQNPWSKQRQSWTQSHTPLMHSLPLFPRYQCAHGLFVYNPLRALS